MWCPQTGPYRARYVRGNDQVLARVAAWMRFVNRNAVHRPAEFGVCVCALGLGFDWVDSVSGSLRIKVHCKREAG
jgi:hypothetical protein